MDAADSFRAFWGKAQPVPGLGDGATGWHPLWMHSLDVAAVGSVLAARHPAPFVRMADELGRPAETLVRLWTLALAFRATDPGWNPEPHAARLHTEGDDARSGPG